jgi:hypothetical protein
MKNIGVIDYYLDEWHSNHYLEWMENVFRGREKRDFNLSYAYADIDRPGGMTTDQWCSTCNVQRMDTIEELVEKSDGIIIFSPDNPEHHERLSSLALKSGKPVFIDKTFSPDLAAGIRMFEEAEKYGTPLFSSSCLRYSDEILDLKKKVDLSQIEYTATQGPGSFEIYSVHQLEMIVSLMSTGAKSVKSLSTANGRMLAIDYSDGRMASLIQFADTPYSISVALKDGTDRHISTVSHLFENLISDIFDFMSSGIPPVKKEETLEIMALIDASKKALAGFDQWVNVNQAL